MIPRSILAVTDFSIQGTHAVARAALLCAKHRATLKLVYLAPVDETPPPDAAVRLSHHALQLQQRHPISVHAATRTDFTAANVAVEAKSVDLVVWGTAPLRGLRAWLSVHPALRMLRGTPRPVLVVRQRAERPYQSVMVAVDFSAASRRLAEWAAALNPSAQIGLFHAIDTANEGKLRYAEVSEQAIRMYREECRRHAQSRMLTLLDSNDARRNRLFSAMGRGDPARQALVQQHSMGSDLIVVGKRPRSWLSDWVFESVAQRVLHGARTDVLIAPHGFQPASRGAAIERLATDRPVRRVKAGAPRPPGYPNPAAMPAET